jgi:surfeit locus 1 family protein
VKRWSLFFLCLLSASLFFALGVWQLERRVWKLALIDRVETRIHAPPSLLPPSRDWTTVNPEQDEYRRVKLRGRYLYSGETLVDALTVRGHGAWVLTPLATSTGLVLVNRGFVPSDAVEKENRPSGDVTVVGLLRISEPEGRFLRPNQPLLGKWFSRDVAAIAAARHLGIVAPFFVDAEASGTQGYPVGGLTVVQFRNMHLFYAVTWFALAVMSGCGAWLVARPGRNA